MALLFGMAIFAGCTGPAGSLSTTGPDLSVLSQKQYAVQEPVETWIPSKVDGKLLHAAVFLPDAVDAGVKVPVFVNFSPYWGDTAMTKGDPFGHYMVDEYVPRGYAVALSAVRGTGHSEGCFQIAGDLELQDTRDVIDFLAEQPWSNGNVGAGGKSYDSTTQNGVIAKYPTPALKTIFHVSGITDMYAYNAKDGVPYRDGLTFNHWYWQQTFHEYGIEWPKPPVPVPTPPTPIPLPADADDAWRGGSPEGAGGRGDEDPESLARVLDDAACAEYPEIEAAGLGTAVTGVKDAYWVERDWARFLPRSAWQGSIFFVHGLQDWNVKPDHLDPWLEAVQAQGLEVKGWLHQERFNDGHVYPMREDWNVTMLRWLDHYLKGIDTGIDRELGFEVQGSDRMWRRDSAWPPKSMPKLVATAGTPPGSGQTLDVLAGQRFAGVGWAHVQVTSTSADPILRIALYDEDTDGNLTFLSEAVKRVALNDDLSAARPWVPGTSGLFNLTLYPLDWEVQTGHNLVIVPGLDPSQQQTPTPADFWYTPAQASGTIYDSIQVYLPSAGGLLVDPQPVPTPCWAC